MSLIIFVGCDDRLRGFFQAVALALNRADWLDRMGYTMAEAIDRVGQEWLALIPAVARQLVYEGEVEQGEIAP